MKTIEIGKMFVMFNNKFWRKKYTMYSITIYNKFWRKKYTIYSITIYNKYLQKQTIAMMWIDNLYFINNF